MPAMGSTLASDVSLQTAKMTSWLDADWPTFPNLVKLPTPGDASCLVHAVLAGITDTHKITMTTARPQATARAVKIRNAMADLLACHYERLFGDWKDIEYEMSSGEMRRYDQATLDSMLRNKKTFLTQEFAILLSEIFSVNILILDQDRKRGYVSDNTERTYSVKRKGTVLVLYTESGVHFTLAGLRLPSGKIVTHIAPDDDLLIPFRRANKVL